MLSIRTTNLVSLDRLLDQLLREGENDQKIVVNGEEVFREIALQLLQDHAQRYGLEALVEVEPWPSPEKEDKTTAVTGKGKIQISNGKLGVTQFLSEVKRGAELFIFHRHGQLDFLHVQSDRVDLYLEIDGNNSGYKGTKRVIGQFFLWTWPRDRFLERFRQSYRKGARARGLLNQMAREKGAEEKTLSPQEVLERLGLQSFKDLH